MHECVCMCEGGMEDGGKFMNSVLKMTVQEVIMERVIVVIGEG